MGRRSLPTNGADLLQSPGLDHALSYTEGDAPRAIADADTELTDVDSSAFVEVTLAVAGLLDGDDEQLVLDGDSFALATAVAAQDTAGGLYTVSVTPGAGRSAHRSNCLSSRPVER